MSLFQESVLKNYLKRQDHIQVEKAFKKYTKYFHNPIIQQNIRESKEEQFQQKFLIELFDKVLGYTIFPDEKSNLTTEFKNLTGAKKADGAILIDGKAIAVIELKGTKTKDLESIRQQAFDYKANQTGCVYVITSNFEKLRFYINNAVDFEEFNLFTLNQQQFALLYLCLHKDNLLNNLPLKINNDSLVEEEKITKKFYADYSLFKRELYRDLVKQNTKNEVFREELTKEDNEQANKNIKLTLFKKSQKLIDRFLFIFFAEDRGLLPPNSTLKILEQWNKLKELDEEVPLYKRYIKYFNYLDTGRKGTDKVSEIFAYNGGLFKPDPILDSLQIDDELLYKHTNTLANYDFESQVDVNILGHIFENSLNEIENVNAEIEGTEFDKQKTKRKKDGVFYTPKYITKYIVDNTVGKLCTEKKAELGIIEEEYLKSRKGRPVKTLKALQEKLEDYRKWILTLTILDPACGSGAFLNQALDFLIKEHRYIDELQASLLGGSIVFQNIESTILEKNIYGVDLNEESVEIAKLSLWLRTAQPRRQLNMLSNNIKCGNSLIDDKKVAGDKAFNWQEEFPEVFTNGGFDVVIGNPPYVRAELLGLYRSSFERNYAVYNPSGDLFSYFYEQSFKLLKRYIGIFGFISNTFDKTTAGISVREYLQNEIKFLKYIDFTEVQIFEGATTYPVILIAQNKNEIENSFTYIKIPKSSQASILDIDLHTFVSVSQHTLNKVNWSFQSNQSVKLINRLKKQKTIREIYGKCYYGVKTALNEAFIIPKKYQISEHVKPISEGKELTKWISPDSVQQLILFQSKWTRKKYGDNISEKDATEKLRNDFPDLINHLIPFEDKAKKRYDKGDFFWELRNCAYYDLFEKPKVVFPNLQNSNKFAFDETGAYINAPAVILPTEDKFLISILNSKLVWYFLTNICVVRSGGYIEVKPQYFEQIPIPSISNEIKNNLVDLTKLIMNLTKECQGIKRKFLKLLTNKFEEIKISKKLEKWYELSFTDFQKELIKQKIKLSLSDESEWMDFFEEQVKLYSISSQSVNDIEKQIDQMVYELYGLSEEEVRIVEESVK